MIFPHAKMQGRFANRPYDQKDPNVVAGPGPD